MNKSNVIVVHGAYGYPEENWFGWLKRELNNLGVVCTVPQLPTPENQSLNNWLHEFNHVCGDQIHSNTILVGHSLGAAFILRFLEIYQHTILAVLLAGSFFGKVGIEKFDEINKDFFLEPFNWKVIKEKCSQFICFHGGNDPYVSFENFQSIADNLQAKKIIIANAGHMNAAANYTRFPLLLTHLKNLLEVN